MLSDLPRQFQTYNVFFGSFFQRSAFGLYGDGILYFDNTQNKIEVSGEGALPSLIALPLRLIPVVGRGILTFYRPAVAVSFKQTDVSEFVRKDQRIQFKAPKQSGAKSRRIDFYAANETEAQEIEEAIRRQNPNVSAGKFNTVWHWAKLVLVSAVLLAGVFLLVNVGVRAKRFFDASYQFKISLQRFYPDSKLNRQSLTLYEQTLVYPDAAKGLFQRGGYVFIDATFAPDGNISDVKVTDPKNQYSKGITATTNPALIEAAMNSARQIKFAPGNGEVKIQLLYDFKSRYDVAVPPPL